MVDVVHHVDLDPDRFLLLPCCRDTPLLQGSPLLLFIIVNVVIVVVAVIFFFFSSSCSSSSGKY